MATVPPQGDQPLLLFSMNVLARVSPVPADFGLTALQASALGTVVAAYEAALGEATTPITRNKVTIAAKNDARKLLLAKLKEILRVVSAFPGLTAAKRAELGLNPRDTEPTPIQPPATRPLLEVGPDGQLDIIDELLTPRRGKPNGTVGAVVYMKLSAEATVPPATPAEASFAMLATRSRVHLPLPADADQKKLYVLAQWYNQRGELRPVSEVAVTTVAA